MIARAIEVVKIQMLRNMTWIEAKSNMKTPSINPAAATLGMNMRQPDSIQRPMMTSAPPQVTRRNPSEDMLRRNDGKKVSQPVGSMKAEMEA